MASRHLRRLVVPPRTHQQGFADIEVHMHGGYEPTVSDPNSELIQTLLALYRKLRYEPLVWSLGAGSW